MMKKTISVIAIILMIGMLFGCSEAMTALQDLMKQVESYVPEANEEIVTPYPDQNEINEKTNVEDLQTQAPESELIETEATEIPEDVDPTPEVVPQSKYHPRAADEEAANALHLIKLTDDWLDFPVYACSVDPGEVALFVFADNEETGEHGFLRARLELDEDDDIPTLNIDEESGFITEPPAYAKIEFYDEPHPYKELAYGVYKDGDTIEDFYPTTEDGDIEIGAIPIVMTCKDMDNFSFDAIAIYYHPFPSVLMYVSNTITPANRMDPEAEASPEPTPEPVATSAPTKKPASSTPKPTKKPSSTPAPTKTPDHPEGKGHWKQVVVIDQPEVRGEEYRCRVCDYVSTVWDGDFKEHIDAHVRELGAENVMYCIHHYVVQEELWHYETVWVPDP